MWGNYARALVALLMMPLAACDRGVVDRPLDPIVYPYAPRTSANLDGAISVETFRYNRKEDYAENEVDLSVLGGRGQVAIPVGEWIADMVRREFRQAGLAVTGAPCRLSGEIKTLIADWTLLDTTFRVEIRYLLASTADALPLDATYAAQSTNHEHPGRSVPDVFARHIHAAVAQTVLELMRGEAFLSNLARNCQRSR